MRVCACVRVCVCACACYELLLLFNTWALAAKSTGCENSTLELAKFPGKSFRNSKDKLLHLQLCKIDLQASNCPF